MSWQPSEHYRDTFELGTKPQNAQRGPSNEQWGGACRWVYPASNAAGIGKKQVTFLKIKNQEKKFTTDFDAIKEKLKEVFISQYLINPPIKVSVKCLFFNY